jgi:hypothetical protein
MMRVESSDKNAVSRDLLTPSVLRVGGGRGFVVEGREKYIVTAAHCLPVLPEAMPAAASHERTYADLVASLNEEPVLAAECMFVDPVADIAVLGPPDNQELFEEYEQYNTLTGVAPAFRIAKAGEKSRGWILTLEGSWMSCEVGHCGGPLWFKDAARPVAAGMSGSPIIDDAGGVVGIVSMSSGPRHVDGGPNPRLESHLPGWLLKELMAT